MKENMTFAEKDLANLLQVLQSKLSPLKAESSHIHDLAIILTGESFGHGDDGLGKILMKFFLKSLSTGPTKPKLIVLMSGATHLACENSAVFSNLSRLQEQGIKIFIDGTSVDYYRCEEKIKIGQVVSMLSICTEILNSGRVITL